MVQPTASSFSSAHRENRRNSVGVLRDQVLLQSNQESQNPISIPSSVELKLTAQINASKFNRRRYPTQNDYEYLSPQPQPSGKSQTPMGKMNFGIHKTSSVDFDLDQQHLSKQQQQEQIRIVDGQETNRSLLNQAQVLYQSFGASPHKSVDSYLQVPPGQRKLEQDVTSPQHYLNSKISISSRLNNRQALLGDMQFQNNKTPLRATIIDVRLEALSYDQIMNSMHSIQAANNQSPFTATGSTHQSQAHVKNQTMQPTRVLTNNQHYSNTASHDSARASPVSRLAPNHQPFNQGQAEHDASSLYNSQFHAFSSTASVIGGQHDDDFTRDQLQKILKKRMRKQTLVNSRQQTSSLHHKTVEMNQGRGADNVTMMSYVQSTNTHKPQPLGSGPKPLGDQSQDPNFASAGDNVKIRQSLADQRDDSESSVVEEDLVESSRLARMEKKAQKERERREREHKLYLDKQANRPNLSKEEAADKINFFQLATEKRAQERLRKMQGINSDEELNKFTLKPKKVDVFGTSLGGALSMFLKKQLQDAKNKQAQQQRNEITVLDREKQEFRYKLPEMPKSDGERSTNTLHSFYSKTNNSNHVSVGLQHQVTSQSKTLESRRTSLSKNVLSQSAGKTNVTPIKEDDGSDDDDEQAGTKKDNSATKQKVDAPRTTDQDKKRKLIEEALFKKEQTEQVELCGEEFIADIQKLINTFDSFQIETPVANNGNTINGHSETHSSMDTSEISIQDKQVLDTTMPRKLIQGFSHILKSQAAFFQIAKRVDEPKFNALGNADQKISYFNECLKSHVLCFPVLNRVHNHTLVLQQKVLNLGVCNAIRTVLSLVPTLLHHLYLDSNSMSGLQLQQILEGVLLQSGSFKTLTIQDNEIDQHCVDLISQLAKRRMPDQLDSLNIYFCKIGWNQTEKLLQGIKTSNLRTLSLVKVSLSDQSIPLLESIVEKSKRLTNLDLSWNSIMPKTIKKLLEMIAANRRLQYINLSWNVLCDNTYTEKEQLEIVALLGQVIKRNKQLVHLDLTCTGLTTLIIKELGSCLRRAGSLLSVHLSGNPGLTEENCDYLQNRIKCREREDIERFARIQNLLSVYQKEVPIQLREGIVRKMNILTTFKKNTTEPMEKLVFQRMMGFKVEQPGSGQWYESSTAAVSNNKHYKNDCWICEKHVYTMLLWSRGRAYFLNPIFPSDQSEKVRFEIDCVSQEDLGIDPGLGHVKGNLPYDKLEDKIPYLAGSFTGWRYKKMIPLHEFNQSMDTDQKDPLEVCYNQGTIRRKVTTREEMKRQEKVDYDIVAAKQRKMYRVHWAKYFNKYLTYKQPYLVNGACYHNIDDELDVLDYYGSSVKRVMLDMGTPASVDSEEDFEPKVMTAEATDENDVPDRRPKPPDESKWDIVYCLPFFAKPGRHTYMIKQKNTDEKFQRRTLRKQRRMKEDILIAQNEGKDTSLHFQVLQQLTNDLKPELFFYNCQVINRVETIPISFKTMANKVIQRFFVKNTSVFKQWHEETGSKQKDSIESDCSLWKISKFINKKGEELEVDACKALILQHAPFLKEIFVNIMSTSSYPAITMMAISQWVTKAKIVEGDFTNQVVDRLFISANFQPAENPKFATIGNALVRFEFWELLVRIAGMKYKETGVVATYSAALEKLITDKLIPFAQPEPWQQFRNKQLWTIEVNDILEANHKNLEKIYANYFTSVKKFILYEDVIDMCVKQADLQVPDTDIMFSFGMSKMVVSVEPKDYKKYTIMLFPEYLEFIGRLADCKFKNSDMSTQGLAWKIEQVLEELCPAFGLIKKDVNVGQEDASESDDDY